MARARRRAYTDVRLKDFITERDMEAISTKAKAKAKAASKWQSRGAGPSVPTSTGASSSGRNAPGGNISRAQASGEESRRREEGLQRRPEQLQAELVVRDNELRQLKAQPNDDSEWPQPSSVPPKKADKGKGRSNPSGGSASGGCPPAASGQTERRATPARGEDLAALPQREPDDAPARQEGVEEDLPPMDVVGTITPIKFRNVDFDDEVIDHVAHLMQHVPFCSECRVINPDRITLDPLSFISQQFAYLSPALSMNGQPRRDNTPKPALPTPIEACVRPTQSSTTATVRTSVRQAPVLSPRVSGSRPCSGRVS